jgi:hypothetical protein
VTANRALHIILNAWEMEAQEPLPFAEEVDFTCGDLCEAEQTLRRLGMWSLTPQYMSGLLVDRCRSIEEMRN